jgi:hypothetical protein
MSIRRFFGSLQPLEIPDSEILKSAIIGSQRRGNSSKIGTPDVLFKEPGGIARRGYRRTSMKPSSALKELVNAC